MAQAELKEPLGKDAVVDVGDRVIVDKDKKGQIKWKGELRKVGPGVWYGIRLVEKRGDHNGTYKGNKLFWCPHPYGVVVQMKRIKFRYTGDDFDFMGEEEPPRDDATHRAIKEKRQAMKALKQKFRDMDADGNMIVDVDEFFKLIQTMFPKITKAESKKLFFEIDVTKSGEISFAEFDSWIKSIGGLGTLEHKDFIAIRQKFQEMDKDGDSTIDIEEFLAVCTDLFNGITGAEARALFAEIDTSGDGKIQFREYDAWVKAQEGPGGQA